MSAFEYVDRRRLAVPPIVMIEEWVSRPGSLRKRGGRLGRCGSDGRDSVMDVEGR